MNTGITDIVQEIKSLYGLGDAASKLESFKASNRGQASCRCTLDQWLDLIGVITS